MIKATYKLNGQEMVYYFYTDLWKNLIDPKVIEEFKNYLPITDGVTDFKLKYDK